MYELNKQLEMNGYNNYYADVEFNKVGKKEKRIKLLPDNKGTLKRIFTDMIVHSRGQARPDNLIALEMKKSRAKKLSRENDRERLMQLTKQDVFFNNRYIYRYNLGIYYEIDLKKEEILVEFYQDGSKVEEKVSKFQMIAARQVGADALRLGRTQKAARGACGEVVLDYFIQPAFQPESF